MSSVVVVAIWVAAAVGLAVFGVRFHRRQANGGLGGRISPPKAYWLCFAIFFWFVLCPTVALDDVLAPVLRDALLVFSISMAARGAIEMILLYGTKSWRPPMGIGHDVLSIALLVGVLAHGRDAVLVVLRRGPDLDRWGLVLIGGLLVSLVVEIHHARRFAVAVAGQTTGDRGVWFADDAQERFARINRDTRVWNAVLTAWVLAFVARYAIVAVEGGGHGGPP